MLEAWCVACRTYSCENERSSHEAPESLQIAANETVLISSAETNELPPIPLCPPPTGCFLKRQLSNKQETKLFHCRQSEEMYWNRPHNPRHIIEMRWQNSIYSRVYEWNIHITYHVILFVIWLNGQFIIAVCSINEYLMIESIHIRSFVIRIRLN